MIDTEIVKCNVFQTVSVILGIGFASVYFYK